MRNSILCAFTCTILLLSPELSSATSLGSPYVPEDSWVYPVCDYFVDCGVVPGYAKDYFNGEQGRLPQEFAGFIAILFDVLAQTDAAADPRLALFDLEQLKAQLFEEFKYSLSVTRVRPADPKTAWPGRAGYFSGLLRLTSKDFPVPELFALIESYPATSSTLLQSAYDDVPRTAPWYGLLAEACRAGALEGYPENFFDGERTLTRYEFAQAVARMLDRIEATDYGWWNPNLEKAEQAGFKRRGIAELVLEFAPEMEELGD
ncbi:hypothetical protein IT575_12295 [bacterium]|nr:hypothetical protein [bacterium]